MKLSAKKRLELIDRELHEKGQVFSRDLAERCETSMETIRKDLEMLEASGVAVKVYGGALLAQTGAERLVSMRVQGQEQKQKIGRLAARLLEGAHPVILDSGTTVLAAVPYINRMPAMNIMTCSLDAFEALDGSHHQVFLTGGKKREKNRSLVGFGAQESIQRFHGDICLMGTAGLKDMAGPSSHSYQEIELKQTMCRQCDQVIVLADSAKFRESGLHQWGNWEDVDMLVTGPGISPAAVSNLEKQVRIIQSPEDLKEN